ncbi:hypothetical protein OH809_03200 [Streptomyces sp. NBC_00873]|uniref:hypothetical protein n=1 Tax=unclassified Streptomyces TaxID=2593676 RepID=UPI003863443B|nr:hypothetical protein OH809_03200 [Streptomyces sp. NBC_00873]WTA48110.1 hypothetical protein OH821_40605 [Streptomyces sp. NBC_00842]
MPSTAIATPSAATASDPVADGSKSEEEYALEQAKASGQPYELTSVRTESTDTWALPDGTWSVKRYNTPVRLLRDGAWIPTDANLVFAANGATYAEVLPGVDLQLKAEIEGFSQLLVVKTAQAAQNPELAKPR